MCLAIAGVASFAGPAQPPKDAGLVEHVERRLFPLTVRIRALTPQDRATAAHLLKSDFVVFVNRTKIAPEQIELDNYCSELPERDAPEQPEPSKHLLLFTDRMGLEGQVNTNAMLRNMIPRLAADGYQLRLVPGGDPEWSNDSDRLLRDVAAPAPQANNNFSDPLGSSFLVRYCCSANPCRSSLTEHQCSPDKRSFFADEIVG